MLYIISTLPTLDYMLQITWALLIIIGLNALDYFDIANIGLNALDYLDIANIGLNDYFDIANIGLNALDYLDIANNYWIECSELPGHR